MSELEPDYEPDHYIKRITLPSGKVIEIVYPKDDSSTSPEANVDSGMERYVDRFIDALDQDEIVPEDFL
jgi:hypothetical protein